MRSTLRAALRLSAVGLPLLSVAARAHRIVPSGGTASFRGLVVRQSDGGPIMGADIWLIAANRHARTDTSGTFAIDSVAPGSQLVQIRAIGFEARRDTVTVPAGASVERRYDLVSRAAILDTVRTVAPERAYISPVLRAFESRRLSGEGGHFISDSVLRTNDNSTLANVVRGRIPGVTFERGRLVSTRKTCRGPALSLCTRADCYVAIYVNGVLEFRSQMTDLPGVEAPDLSRMNVSDYAGVEFYADASSAPIGMHPDDDGCGSLWLWTREK